jgi:nucleoside-diphosphate-sugar epimerase
MTILITGAHGFVGKHVVHELETRGHELLKPSSKELNLLNHGRDSASEVGCYCTENQIEAIVHLAGNVGGIGYNKNNQGRLGFENLQMGVNILEAARLATIKKLVILGTTCSYPQIPKTIPFIEDEIFDGMPELTNSGYGIAKRTIIKLGIEYHKQYDMNITNLVPANMYGTYDHFEDSKSHVIPAIIKKFEYPDESPTVPGIAPTCVNLWGSGKVSREFLYVTDCARAIVMSLEKDTGPEPINLGTGCETTIAALAEMIKDIGQYDSAILWNTRQPDGQPRRCLDTTRAKNILNWTADVSLGVGLKYTIDWYRREQISIQ